jgi:hypothetical protein
VFRNSENGGWPGRHSRLVRLPQFGDAGIQRDAVGPDGHQFGHVHRVQVSQGSNKVLIQFGLKMNQYQQERAIDFQPDDEFCPQTQLQPGEEQ